MVGVGQTSVTDTARATQADTLGEFMQPPTTPGREEVVDGGEGTGGVKDGQGTVREGGAAPAIPSGDGSVTGRQTGMFKQASIRRWTENSSQQHLDIAWGMHLNEHGAPFNYVTGEKTQELHELYLELGEKRQRVEISSRMQMATVVLDIAYERTQEAIKPLMDCWDIICCTVITDGCTDRKFRPVMNFIDAAESGAVMLKVVDMSKRKKNAVSLAKLWEGVTREIRVHRVNALCTDNAEVNKTLVIPTEVRFASVYMMLERLLDRKKVLKAMMKEGWLDIKWAARKKRNIAERVYLTVRSEELWEKVEAVVDVMTPMYDLLRQMDKSDTAPYQLWGFEEALVKKIRTIAGITVERQKAIAKKVKKNKQAGFIDMWANFFDEDVPPPLVDADIVPDDGELSAEEVARRLRFRKTASARVPKVGKVDESSDTDSSDDGEDLVWRGKGKKQKDVECLDGASRRERKAPMEEFDDDGDSHEEDEVEEMNSAAFALHAPLESDEDSDDDDDDMTLRQDAGQMDSDLEFLLPRTRDSHNAMQTEN
ncbi:hypothetical protein CBR_g19589 [Chara braunii]|uniref:DUF659 domain-containing protein n=1 Tax=Chara braunii TaxID=69332 RepID=A0A388KYD8_CHABU|nr:hypothetical protein CBR_g19589 [Chara braunii]|eukprot:GBG75076.1 hypothetical protein CBR_g19589 [Chara braunii]